MRNVILSPFTLHHSNPSFPSEFCGYGGHNLVSIIREIKVINLINLKYILVINFITIWNTFKFISASYSLFCWMPVHLSRFLYFSLFLYVLFSMSWHTFSSSLFRKTALMVEFCVFVSDNVLLLFLRSFILQSS